MTPSCSPPSCLSSLSFPFLPLVIRAYEYNTAVHHRNSAATLHFARGYADMANSLVNSNDPQRAEHAFRNALALDDVSFKSVVAWSWHGQGGA